MTRGWAYWFKGLLLAALLVGGVPGQYAQGDERRRIDLFDTQSRRTGSAIVDDRTGRIDFYDTKSNRTGYGTLHPDGRLDRYDTKSRRSGSGTVSSRGKR